MQKTMVYRSPASNLKNACVDRATGETYEHKIVNAESVAEGEQSELDVALESGWYDSPKAAIEAVPVVDTPPTRAEMEQKARELNIEFDDTTEDELLLMLINDALKESEGAFL